MQQIYDWALQRSGPSIFCLTGAAGIGKSTISSTFANWLTDPGRNENIDLGASFFFQGQVNGTRASHLFSNILLDLVSKLPGLDRLVSEAMASDPSISEKTLPVQFEKLIYQPLQDLKPSRPRSPTLVVIIDALDECERGKDRRAILNLCSLLPSITSVQLKLFIASRSKPDFRPIFTTIPANAHREMNLDRVPRSMIRRDISNFLRYELSIVRENHNTRAALHQRVARDWPGEQILQRLVTMTASSFVVAANLCRYIGTLYLDPQERLEEILQLQGRFDMTKWMDQLEAIVQISRQVEDRITDSGYSGSGASGSQSHGKVLEGIESTSVLDMVPAPGDELTARETQTEYPDIGSLEDASLSDYVAAFADELRLSLPSDFDEADFDRMSPVLDELLQVFASKLRLDGKTPEHHKLIHLLYRYRR